MTKMHKRPLTLLALLSLFLLTHNGAIFASAANTLDLISTIQTSGDQVLESWINTGNTDTVKIGEEITVNLQVKKDAYIYILRIDSNGIGRMIIPSFGASANFVKAGARAIYPGFGDSHSMLAELPTGNESIFVIASDNPLNPHWQDQATGKPISLDTPEYSIEKLVNLLSGATGENGLAMQEHKLVIQPRPGDIEYTATDIVGYFTTRTRAVKRPSAPAQINFEFGSRALTDQARTRLDEWGKALSHPALSSKNFVIAGHTDDIGPDDYNMQLSWDRADAVIDYLSANYGIDRQKLSLEAHGESKPMMDDATDEARSVNRRVEFLEIKN